MNLAARAWIVAVILSFLALSPAEAHAGMTDAEVKEFMRDKALAEKGQRGAQYNMGINYYNGLGVAKDFVQAAGCWRKAAEQGLAEAQVNLGNCYSNGLGVAKDFVQAAAWWRKAAEQGFAQGQTGLGYCYAKGEGVAKDEIEAYAYWNLAGLTDEDARNNLAILEKGMSPDARLIGQQRTKQLRKEIEGRLETAQDLLDAIRKEKMREGI